jgi:hypothetical protein
MADLTNNEINENEILRGGSLSGGALDNDDFVMQFDGEKYVSGGYTINSNLLNGGGSPLYTLNSIKHTVDGDGDNVSNLFKNFVVPAGLFFINQKMPKCNHDEKYSEHSTLSDDLHDKLFALINLNNPIKHKKTKKHSHAIKHKKTKKVAA